VTARRHRGGRTVLGPRAGWAALSVRPWDRHRVDV